MMRKLLYEAAQSMMTRVVKWCWLKAWAMNIGIGAQAPGRHASHVAGWLGIPLDEGGE
jgi:hypothetical protein